MVEPTEPTRRSYLVDETRRKPLNEAVAAILAEHQKAIVRKYMSQENAHRLRHGRSWSHPGLENSEDSELRQHSFEATTKFEDIVNHDLGAIERLVGDLARAMEQQFAQLMFSTLSATCDRSGNVIDAKAAGSMKEAFAQMLEKIEFSAERDGKVSLPQITLGTEAFKKFQEEFANPPPDFTERIEAIKTKKIAEALERERERKARFVKYGEEE